MTRSTLLLDEHGDPYRRKDGRLVRLIQGGSAPTPPAPAAQPAPPAPPTEPPAAPPAAPQFIAPPADPAPAAPPAAPVVPPGASVAPPASPAAGDALADATPERLREIIAELRRENAGARVARNAEQEQQTQAAITAAVEKAKTDAQTELAQTIGKALGLVKDEEPVDPAKLTAQWAEKETGYQRQIRDLTVASALSAALSGTHPGAKDALIGSGKLADLDPTATDFTAQLQARVAEYLEANPYFKVTTPAPLPPAGSSAADFTGSTPPPGGAPSIDDLRAERAKRRAG